VGERGRGEKCELKKKIPEEKRLLKETCEVKEPGE
jgi:hypothetical protein